MTNPKLGVIGWADLTVENAAEVRDFYQQVVDWEPQAVAMGDYVDYNMLADGQAHVGICHARGGNRDLPPAWLLYFTVANLEASLGTCTQLGGEVLVPSRSLGPQGNFAVIRDPGGAVAALHQANEEVGS